MAEPIAILKLYAHRFVLAARRAALWAFGGFRNRKGEQKPPEDMSFDDDPVVNVIYIGIKKPIQLCRDNQCERAALQLMYAAIDSLAQLGLPPSETRCSRTHYGAWCTKYLKFNVCEEVKGLEWFAARCGFLHSYSATSDLSAAGEVRMIGYYSGEGPDVIYNASESTDLVMVRVEGLLDAFFAGLDAFLIDLYKDLDKGLVERRFSEMFHVLPWERD